MKPSELDKRAEQLKDRRDYRHSLIHRREDLDRKLATVETQIRKLNAR